MTALHPDPAWLAGRRRNAAAELRAAVSATHLVRERPGFGWRLSPARGSILASARIAAFSDGVTACGGAAEGCDAEPAGCCSALMLLLERMGGFGEAF